MKLEVVPIPVRDVDAAKDFYTKQAGFRLDHDVRPSETMRIVQMTPPGSACSVVIGEGLPLGEPGSVKGSPARGRGPRRGPQRTSRAGRSASARCSRWGPKALPAHATASSRTLTGTCGQSRNTSARKRTFPMVTRAWPMSGQTGRGTGHRFRDPTWDLSQLSDGLTGRRDYESLPDTRQDADLRLRIAAHWPDARHWSTDLTVALHACRWLAGPVSRPGPRGLPAHG